jgi:UPF0755 protein
MKRTMAKWIYKKGIVSILMVAFFVAAFVLVASGLYLVTPAKKGGQDEIFWVRYGATLREVAEALERRGIIRRKAPLLLWARLAGYGKNLKAGEYRLNPGMPPLKILHLIYRGAVVTHPVTIPEGFTTRQIGALLDEEGLVAQEVFVSLARDADTARRYGLSGPGLEGYLYPDTYHFSRGLPPLSIIDVMVRRFREVIAPLAERISESGMSVEEVVTLASIVEKETGLAKERPLIASVFLNRLRKGMRLESDPTVIYGLEGFDGDLTKKDLSSKTPYNTYVIQGLPPGPIANPGIDAIRAVLYPAETEYIYFVSKNDGSHQFSKTLLEHNRAVARYQRPRGARSGKTP